jgi:hypothetical protein
MPPVAAGALAQGEPFGETALIDLLVMQLEGIR